MSRNCMRPGCDRPAAARLSYDTISCQVWLDQVPERLGPVQEICQFHAERLTVPRGWMLCDRRVDAPALFEPDDRVTPLVAPTTAASMASSTAGSTTAPRRAHRRRHPSSTARQLFDDEPRRIAEVVAPVSVEVDLDSDVELELLAAAPIDLDSDLDSELDSGLDGVAAPAAEAATAASSDVLAIVAPPEPVLQVVAAPVEDPAESAADLEIAPADDAASEIEAEVIEAETAEAVEPEPVEPEPVEAIEPEPEPEPIESETVENETVHPETVEPEPEPIESETVEVVVVELEVVVDDAGTVDEIPVEEAPAAATDPDVAGGLAEVLGAAARNKAANRPMPEHAEIMAEIVSVDPDDELPESLRATSPLLARAFRATGPQRSVLSPDLANPSRDESSD